MSELRERDVREFDPRVRHPLIFSTFDELDSGESFILINDHDPKPIFCQLEAERRDQFRWEYLTTGPEEWQVRITRT